MNKTVSINLSGQVFQIDEQAYDKLAGYLESIRLRFSATDGGQEIISDIEARISEIFNERLNERKQVITLTDVEDVMRLMGRPEEFDVPGEPFAPDPKERKASRRLFRNPDEKVIAGLCSGLSAYFGISDPLWIRLIFILAFVFGIGSSILIYIILWIIIPEAKTSSEKLQMRGRPINISNIEQTIKEDLHDLREKFDNMQTSSAAGNARNFFRQVIDLTINLVVLLFKIIIGAAGIALVLLGSVIIIGLLIALLLPSSVTEISVGALYPALFASKLLFLVAATGFLLTVIIPALLLVVLGFHLLVRRSRRVKGLGVSLLGLWIVGIAMLAFAAAKTSLDFSHTDYVRTEIPLVPPAGDTLILKVSEMYSDVKKEKYMLPEIGNFSLTSSHLVLNHVRLDIKKSISGNFELTQIKEAAGAKSSVALDKASNIENLVEQRNDMLIFDDHFTVPQADSYRNQQVRFLLKMPEGKAVFLDESMSSILHDVKNVTDTYDRHMVGHTWMMLLEGLACLDCDFSNQDKPFFEEKGTAAHFEFSDFNEIDAAGIFNLEIKNQDEFAVSAKGSQRFLDNLEINKVDETLKIKFKRGFQLPGRDRGTIIIAMPSLKNINITGANKAFISGFDEDEMYLEVTGASKVDLNANAARLKVEIGGASEVTLAGEGARIEAEIDGASSLKAFGYKAGAGSVEANGASKAQVHVSDELKASSNGASEILYKGLPKISSDVNGFSSIKPMR